MLGSGLGKLIVISGPSGVGKTTLVKQLFQHCDKPLVASVSATTRAPRANETDGVDYYFLSPSEFLQRREQGQFLECFEVFGRGYWYGTLLSEVEPRVNRGDWVLLEIDVQGAQTVKSSHPDAVTIFVQPESLEQLERRLRGRGTEPEDVIRRRLDVARHEMSIAKNYDYRVTNRTVDEAVAEICRILDRIGSST